MAKIHCASLLLTYTLWILPTSAVADDILNIAAILNVNTPAGKAANTSLHFALQEINGTRLNLTILESQEFVGNVNSLRKCFDTVLQVFIRNDVAAILVQDPKIADFLAPLAEEIQVPILSFSGSHGFGATSGSTYLFPTIQSDYDDMKAIASIAGYFQWKSVIMLYEDNELWLNGVYQLTEALHEFQQDWGNKRTTISEAVALSYWEEQMRETLAELKNRSGVRAFIVHTSVHLALKMFSIAEELEMMSETYVWIVTESIASSFDSLAPSSIQTLQGIVGVKNVPTPQLKELKQRLGLNISSDDGINRIGIQSYNSLKLVASAVSGLDSQNIEIGYDRKTPLNDTDFSGSMLVLRGGELLREKIAETIRASHVNNDLESREYEIVNVVGKSYKTVGFWKKDSGGLKSPRKEKNKLGAIIWPGDTTQVPNGYRKLVVGKVRRSNASDNIEFIGRFWGYTSDTFQAAVDTLPYNLPFVYEDFDKSKSNLSDYDEFVTELFQRNRFDMVVGDATILWNRSLYVGFTQPYTQTGLVMMVPLKSVRGRTWFFLHPFSRALWATVAAFFVFTAFLVWLMEHAHNHEFQGSVVHQLVTSLTSTLSTFVFAQREEVKSSLGKGILAICLFSALILNNSYTAHLTSILTVERLAPSITNTKSLTTSNVQVGYLKTSFVKTYLMYDLKIPRARLVPLGSPHDYVQKIKNGEVDAIVDEIPYIQMVKSLYPSEKLAIVDQGYLKSGGFGFFFREGSPFLSDISEAMLNISENQYTVASIHTKWFGDRTSSSDLETFPTDPNVSPIALSNLWIIFALTASIYAITMFIYICRKIYQKTQDRIASRTWEFSTHILAMIISLTMRAPASIEAQR